MTHSPTTTVLLDLFETLVHNNHGMWRRTFGEICQEQRLPVEPERLWRQWRAIDVRFRQTRTNMQEPERSPPFRTYQSSWKESFADTFALMGLRGDAHLAAQRCAEAMGTRRPFGNTFPVLERLKGCFRLGILTNADSPYVKTLLERYRLPVDVILTSEAARAYKPDPRAFRQILEMLQASPHEAVHVGDHPVDDIYGAHRMGLRTVWLNRYGAAWDSQLPPPDRQITTLAELPDILQSWKG